MADKLSVAAIMASATILFDFIDMELSPDTKATVRPRSEGGPDIYHATLRILDLEEVTESPSQPRQDVQAGGAGT
jgi:hypothetical protein